MSVVMKRACGRVTGSCLDMDPCANCPFWSQGQSTGPVHVLDAGRYFASIDPNGVPRIYRADTAGAVLHIETLHLDGCTLPGDHEGDCDA